MTAAAFYAANAVDGRAFLPRRGHWLVKHLTCATTGHADYALCNSSGMYRGLAPTTRIDQWLDNEGNSRHIAAVTACDIPEAPPPRSVKPGPKPKLLKPPTPEAWLIPNQRLHLTDEHRQAIADAYDANRSLRLTASAFGISTTSVHRALAGKAYGTPP